MHVRVFHGTEPQVAVLKENQKKRRCWVPPILTHAHSPDPGVYSATTPAI